MSTQQSAAQALYGIFWEGIGRRENWPEWWQLREEDQHTFARMAAESSGNPGAAPDRLEAGTYRGKAVQWGLDATAKGTEMIRVMFEVLLAGGATARVRWSGWLTDRCLLPDAEGRPGVTMRGLMACGMTEGDLDTLLRGGEISGLDRNMVELVCERNDRNYVEVSFVNRIGTGDLVISAPPSAAAKAQIAARMRAAMAGLKTSTPAPVTTPARPQSGSAPPEGGGTPCVPCAVAGFTGANPNCPNCLPF